MTWDLDSGRIILRSEIHPETRRGPQGVVACPAMMGKRVSLPWGWGSS